MMTKRLRVGDVAPGDTIDYDGLVVKVISVHASAVYVDHGHAKENVPTTPTGFLPKTMRLANT